MHSLQLNLLRSEVSTADDTHNKCYQNRAASRKAVLGNLDSHLLSSVIFALRNRICNYVVSFEQILQEKLVKLSERQDKPLRSPNENSVVFLENIILSGLIRDFLAFGPIA